MTQFVHTEKTTEPKVLDGALGADASTGKFTLTEVGKAVKRGTAQNYVFCAAGDEIEGFVSSVEAYTVNDGFAFGGVQTEGRKLAQVGTGQTGTMAVNDYVVADTQVAIGTAGSPKVKTGPTAAVGAITCPTTGTADAGNTGGGTMTAVTKGNSAEAGTYTIECITAATGAGTFKVTSPSGDALPDAEVGVAYVNPQINFTINDGTPDYAVGDKFTVAMTQAASVQAAPTKFLWRCIRIVTGTGAAGDTVLLERV